MWLQLTKGGIKGRCIEGNSVQSIAGPKAVRCSDDGVWRDERPCAACIHWQCQVKNRAAQCVFLSEGYAHRLLILLRRLHDAGRTCPYIRSVDVAPRLEHKGTFEYSNPSRCPIEWSRRQQIEAAR